MSVDNELDKIVDEKVCAEFLLPLPTLVPDHRY